MPVECSAIAGGTGTKSRGRNRLIHFSRSPRLRALASAMNFSAARFGKASGTFDSDSAPPASTISASPRRIASAPLVSARLAEAQARFTVVPGIDAGSAARKRISRPRLGACSAATTTPKMAKSISAGSIPARATTSAAGMPARSMTSSSRRSLPARANGVRQASTIATRPSGSAQLLARDAQHPGRRARRSHPPRPDRVGAQLHLRRRRGVVGRRQRRRRLAQVRVVSAIALSFVRETGEVYRFPREQPPVCRDGIRERSSDSRAGTRPMRFAMLTASYVPRLGEA